MSLANSSWELKHFQVAMFLAVVLLAGWPTTANAQLQVPLVRGDLGLQGGSQPPPGVYLTGLLYVYDTHTIVDQNGIHRQRVGLDQWFAGVDLMFVAKKKVLGGNYSAQVVLPITNVAVDTPFKNNVTGVGYSDTYVQPINLGWHQKRHDTVAWYGLYIPTGRFTDGAENNSGLGMWSHEFGAGTTVFLNEKKQWHAAITGTYNIQSHIKDTNKKAGDVVSLEGGVGRTFCSGLCNAGLDYYTQWKVTQDDFANLPNGFLGKHRYYGLGPEVNGTIPINQTTLAIFKLAAFHELGDRVAFQGNSIIMSVTWAKLSH
jgi:hypothetical protein